MTKYRFQCIASLLFLLTFSACNNKQKTKVDVSNIPAKVEIIRFDKVFYGQPVQKLDSIKKAYSFLFPKKVPDSIWHKQMRDSLVLDLKKEVDKKFPDLNTYKPQIADLFKHIKYYNKDFKEPVIYTMYSNWNFTSKAIYADSLQLLALDNFLGADNPIYKGIPNYIRQNLRPERIPVEIANSIIEKQVKPSKSKSFVARMVNYGKRLYLLDLYMPDLPDAEKIGYNPEKMKWAQENEKDVWKYFIDKKLLFNSAQSLDMRFLNLAPYSKFYSEEDMKTPGRIGQYIGWQIVRSYMQKNKVSLQELLQADEEEIFKKSNYKPKK